MYYLATLMGRDDVPGAEPGSPEFEAEVAQYAAFDEAVGEVVAGGAALYPSAESRQIRRLNGQVLVTDGPFVEHAEVVGGFYVFDVENLDQVIELARQLPAAADGTIELRPIAVYTPHDVPNADWWMALLWETPEAVIAPDTPAWDSAAADHQRFGEQYAEAIRGGGALHPPSDATTLRVREGRLQLTDGPYPEFAEVIDGLYLFAAPDRAAATEIAIRIPVSDTGRTELRQVVDLGE
ncbi:MAG TPA: YciI family protein [Aldersonia sp.]